MPILPIIIAPDARLKTKSFLVESVDEEIKDLVHDMFETMYAARGIGLAAVQVGVHKQVLVADVEWRDEDDKISASGRQHVLINPEIISDSGDKHVYKEGCLSFPEQYAEVTRPSTIRVKYMDLEGKTREERFEGLLATCIQHEIDHINGITFVDHISSVKRDMITRKLVKLKKAGAFEPCHHEHGEHCNH